MLRLAIQKSGRLTDGSYALISECGIEVDKINGKLKVPAYNFPLELMALRDDDIPRYVEDGVVDVAIVGQNVVAEGSANVEIIRPLKFGRCRLSIGVKRETEYQGVSSLSNLRIATSYPKILRNFLNENKITAEIHEISGSVEVAPSIGLADAICDLVSSGSTLLNNGLKEVEKIFTSEAVLIANPNLSREKQALCDQLNFRIDAVLRAKHSKYIVLNTPNECIPAITAILPGLKSPTITPLQDAGWSALHTVVEEDDFWSIIEKLRGAGAQGILVLPIEKVIV